MQLLSFHLLDATFLQSLEVLLGETKAATRFKSPTLYFITHLKSNSLGKT